MGHHGQSIIRGTSEDRMAYDWARREQGYEGTWEQWRSMSLAERQQYEHGAACGSTPRKIAEGPRPANGHT